MAAPRTAPKGVYRYRSHDEANRDAERWAIDAMVERNLELADCGTGRSASANPPANRWNRMC